MARRRKRRIRNRLILGVVLGLLTGHGLDALPLIELDSNGRVWVVAVVAPLTLLLATLSGKFGSLFEVKWSAIYRFRVPHPTSVWRRRVCGYIGQTTRKPEIRRDEHLYGSSYGDPPQPWSDMVDENDWDLIHPWKRRPVILVNFLEWVNIKIRLPIYNDKMNHTNPRRITKTRQIAQRAQRDAARLARPRRRVLG